MATKIPALFIYFLYALVNIFLNMFKLSEKLVIVWLLQLAVCLVAVLSQKRLNIFVWNWQFISDLSWCNILIFPICSSWSFDTSRRKNPGGFCFVFFLFPPVFLGFSYFFLPVFPFIFFSFLCSYNFLFLLLLIFFFFFLLQNLKDVRFCQRKRRNALYLPEKSTLLHCPSLQQAEQFLNCLFFELTFFKGNIQQYHHSA